MLEYSASDGPTTSPGAHRRWLRPRSITGLLVTSFALVAAPLIVAIVASVIYVDTLNDQSEHLVKQGVEVTRASKRLNSLVLSMERSARQYRVLQTDELRKRFRKRVQTFDQELRALADLELDTVPDWNLAQLTGEVNRLSARLGTDPEATDAVIQSLGSISDQTDRIADQGARFVDQELEHLRQTATQARLFLLLCVFALIPAVIALGIFLSWVIGRPLRQILRAVTRLGDADFDQEIEVVAPAAELDALGARLDWMRRRLATLENEKQQFIRNMSHELKTPLASIREGTELLRDGTVGQLSTSQLEVFEILQRNSEELASLIDNLLDFAAWQQRRARLEYTRFDLNALIEAIVARHKLTIEGKHLHVVQPESSLTITADRDRMQLIIDNLVANAIKYAPTHSRVGLETTTDDQGADIVLTDQGPGVAENEREAIFDAFYKGAPPATPGNGVKGTGIGLSVVRDCVHAHGGHITVDTADDGGARFHLHIPFPHAL